MPWTKGEQVNFAISKNAARPGPTARSPPVTPCSAAPRASQSPTTIPPATSTSSGPTRPASTPGCRCCPPRTSTVQPAGQRRGRHRQRRADRQPRLGARRCRSTATACARPSSRGSPAARPAASPSRSTGRRLTATELRRVRRRLGRLRRPVAERARHDAHVRPGEGDDPSVPLRLDLPERARLRPGRARRRSHARGLLRDRLNQVTGKLSVVFDRTNKKPDKALGHLATPMVVTQTVAPRTRAAVTVTGRAVRPQLHRRPGGRCALERTRPRCPG